MNGLPPERMARLQKQIGRMFKREVPDTTELRRVLNLPRRDWRKEVLPEIGDINNIAYWIDQLFSKGTMHCWPQQAKSLQELMDHGYLISELDVGDGKTLVTFLVPSILAAERPLLVVPSKLVLKTQRDFATLREHWVEHPNYAITSFELISREGGRAILESVDPDLIVADEVHRWSNLDAAGTRLIDEWMARGRTRFIPLSATLWDRELHKVVHIIQWAIPDPDKRPLPNDEAQLQAWADATDIIKTNQQRTASSVGALKLLCNDAELQLGRKGVRKALGRRVHETPGFVSSGGEGCSAALNIELTCVQGYGAEVLRLAQGLLDGEKPNGDPITDWDLSVRWQTTRTLTSGFWYERFPPPPTTWLSRRRSWTKIVRRTLDLRAPGLESEMRIAKAASRGELDKEACSVYARWKSVEDEYTETTRAVWVDDRMIEFVAQWTKKHTGIIWVCEIALGERLEKDLGLSYYHEQGLNRDKQFIDDAPKNRSLVASHGSNFEGRNLQHLCEELVISVSPVGKEHQQRLGRMHRSGQKADEVWSEIAIASSVELDCWAQALEDTGHSADMSTQRKKLQIATITPFEKPKERNALWM